MEDERTRVSWGCWLECGISEGAKDPPLTHQAWFTAADLASYHRETPLSAWLRCGPVATQKQRAGNLIEKIRGLVQTHGLYFIHKRRQMARLEMRNFWFVVLLIWGAFFHVKEKDRNLAGSLYEGGQLISSVLILDGWGDEQKTKYKFQVNCFSTKTVTLYNVKCGTSFNGLEKLKLMFMVFKCHKTEKLNTNND